MRFLEAGSSDQAQRGLTAWQLVQQSFLCHPDWDARTHLDFIRNEPEGAHINVSLLGRPGEGAVECIARWLDEMREAKAVTEAWRETPVVK